MMKRSVDVEKIVAPINGGDLVLEIAVDKEGYVFTTFCFAYRGIRRIPVPPLVRSDWGCRYFGTRKFKDIAKRIPCLKDIYPEI